MLASAEYDIDRAASMAALITAAGDGPAALSPRIRRPTQAEDAPPTSPTLSQQEDAASEASTYEALDDGPVKQEPTESSRTTQPTKSWSFKDLFERKPEPRSPVMETACIEPIEEPVIDHIDMLMHSAVACADCSKATISSDSDDDNATCRDQPAAMRQLFTVRT